MRRAKLNQAAIVQLNVSPSADPEQQADFCLALILSPAAYNATGLAVVVPIMPVGDFARYAGFAVPLSGTKTQGVVLCNQLRTVDLEARGAKLIESVPMVVIDDVLARVKALFQ